MALQDELLELAAHMEWADALVWSTTLQSGPARGDERLRGWLHHIHTVQHAFTAIWLGATPAPVGVGSFADLPALASWGRGAHAGVRAFLSSADDESLGKTIELPWAGRAIERHEAVSHPTLAETARQVAMHSMHHRGQVNARLRELGAEAPLVDYIAWIWRGRPEPMWPRNVAAPGA
ncbi:MAG: damage-inducible protein DinB [Acidobacteria bacterium]|nr:damage-inducible protein DinB [Acidobacteriota bacterium]